MPDEKDKDNTPIEPLMERKRSSQRAMTAIGWVECPKCRGDERADCDLCWDEQDKRFNRRVPVDVWIEWRRTLGTVDTEPEMKAVKPGKS
jgi:hypothetical protein